MKERTAGDPMHEGVYWTNFSQREIAKLMQACGHKISTFVVKQLLKKHSFGQRKVQKRTTMKRVANRNQQFEKIAELKESYKLKGNPVISMDTKKKEHLGNFQRAGKLYTQKTLNSYDHDFKSFAEGIMIPHALYDLKHNHGYLYLGNSSDTSEFACENIELWWQNYGQEKYPLAKSILLLCDGGGSNSSRHYIFKEDLKKLVDKLGIEIRVAHYPPYCSKYNPIEHLLFPHVTKAMQGVILTNLECARNLILNTSTINGLSVTVNIVDKVYKTGRSYSHTFRENLPIIFDDTLPNWNYCATPTS